MTFTVKVHAFEGGTGKYLGWDFVTVEGDDREDAKVFLHHSVLSSNRPGASLQPDLRTLKAVKEAMKQP
jgi:hypothetical protein